MPNVKSFSRRVYAARMRAYAHRRRVGAAAKRGRISKKAKQQISERRREHGTVDDV